MPTNKSEYGMIMDCWNRCGVCGKFIAMADFDRGAIRRLVHPDTEFTCEKWETLCCTHASAAMRRVQ
jgi:hypothetical protein